MCGSGVAGQTIFGIPHQSPARIASAMANLSSSHNNSFHCSGGGCGGVRALIASLISSHSIALSGAHPAAARYGMTPLKDSFVERLDLNLKLSDFRSC